MNQTRNYALLILLLIPGIALLGTAAHADPILTVTLDPVDGAVTGLAGSTVGWGFTITDTSDTDYVLVSLTDFCPNGVDVNCQSSGPFLGNYTDNLSQGPYSVLNPGQTLTSGPDDLGSLAIDPSVAPGTYSGSIEIFYDDVSADFSTFTPETFSADASIDVTTTPEPASLLLLASGLGALLSKRRSKNAAGG